MKDFLKVGLIAFVITVLAIAIIMPFTVLLDNDSRHIRTFSGVHTLVYKGTLWRLEPVELGKAEATVVSVIDTVGHCDYSDSARTPLTWNFSNVKVDTLWYGALIEKR